MIQPEISNVEAVQSFARLKTKTQVTGFDWLLPEIHPELCNSGSTIDRPDSKVCTERSAVE